MKVIQKYLFIVKKSHILFIVILFISFAANALEAKFAYSTENALPYGKLIHTVGDITLSYEKNGGSSAPSYPDLSTSLILRSKNKIVLSCDSKIKISKIQLNLRDSYDLQFEVSQPGMNYTINGTKKVHIIEGIATNGTSITNASATITSKINVITVTYEIGETGGAELTQSNGKIVINGKKSGIEVSANSNFKLNIYDLSGNPLIINKDITTGDNYIPMPAGIYIVTADSITQKVVVR
ncbi:MAG: T9SS type A sorting domain-containing protein [Muribaculaceae bacterium]